MSKWLNKRGSELDLSLIVWRCYISNFRVLALILPDFSRFPHEWRRSDCVSKVVSHPTCRARSLGWRVVEQKKWPSYFFLKGGERAEIPPPPAPWKICELCYYCHLLRKTYRERLLPSNCSVYWSAVPRSKQIMRLTQILVCFLILRINVWWERGT